MFFPGKNSIFGCRPVRSPGKTAFLGAERTESLEKAALLGAERTTSLEQHFWVQTPSLLPAPLPKAHYKAQTTGHAIVAQGKQQEQQGPCTTTMTTIIIAIGEDERETTDRSCYYGRRRHAAYGFTGAFGRNLCKFTFPQRRRNLRKSLPKTTRPTGVKRAKKMAALKITLANA